MHDTAGDKVTLRIEEQEPYLCTDKMLWTYNCRYKTTRKGTVCKDSFIFMPTVSLGRVAEQQPEEDSKLPAFRGTFWARG